MKKYILYIFLMTVSYASSAQELTDPQVVGIPAGTPMTVSFPFKIVGVPFSEIPGAVWPKNPSAMVKADILMYYYMEGDEKKYFNKTTFLANIREGGKWGFPALIIYPKPYHIPGKKVDEKRTYYRLNIYQSHQAKKSNYWYTVIKRDENIPATISAVDQKHVTHKIPGQQPAIDKILDQKLGPKVVSPKDKRVLNPQPIPPKERKIKTGGL